MKTLLPSLFIISSLLLGRVAYPAALISDSPTDRIKVFYHKEDGTGWLAVLKGITTAIGVRETPSDALSKSVQDKSKVSVRLFNHEGVKAGDVLYVINDKNLIVARIEVKSVYYSKSFGYMLVGYGNLRLAQTGNRVIQRIEDQYSKYAYIYKSRGDYHQRMGDEAESISQYKKAIEMDRGNPEAHLVLGSLYLKSDLLQFAYREFQEAYANIGRLYDNEDRFELLKALAETRYREVYYTAIPDRLKKKYTDDGIRFAKEALAMYKDSKEINFYLGMFYFKSPEPSDKDARDLFMKVIELDPENVDAHVALSELYYRHRNKEKSRRYADEALRLDPANERARYLKQINEKE